MHNLARVEPDIEEILKDPITGQIMKSYGVHEQDLRTLLYTAAHEITHLRKTAS